MPIVINTVTVPDESKSVVHDEILKGFALVGDDAAPGNNKYYGTDGAGSKGFHDFPAGDAYSEYNAGSNWWVDAQLGVTVTPGVTGNYAIDIPDGVKVRKVWFDFTDELTEFTGGGNVILTIDKNSASINQNRATAKMPSVFFIDSGGNLRQPGDVAVTVQMTSVAGGVLSLSILNINGLGTPVQMFLHNI